MIVDYLTADVFTSNRFGGNPLAVIPDARGLSSDEMLSITREFNYSETVFVLPPEDAANARRLRIFTPGGEIPFAGHPTVGTAHVLAATGRLPLAGDFTRIVFEEGVGPVPVTIHANQGVPVFCQLSAASLPLESSPSADSASIAEALSLPREELLDGHYAPRVVSVGLSFLIVPLVSNDAVRRARVRIEPWERMLAGGPGSEIMVFAMGAAAAGADVHARVFVPGLSIPEDPATGSACAALAGYLASRTPRDNALLAWSVSQGTEMGRPSRLEVEADKREGAITAVRVGGETVMVSEGRMVVRDTPYALPPVSAARSLVQ